MRDGKAHFSNVPVEFQGSADGQIHDQTFSSRVTLPDQFALGFSFKPLRALKVNFDVDYFAWQTFRELAINFADPTLSQTIPKNWHHSWNYHLGGEYQLMPNLWVRLGLMLDPTPSPASTLGPDVPDATRVNVGAGVGYHWHEFNVDFGYQCVIFTDTTSTLPALPGTYNGTVQVLNLSLTYTMGR